MEVYERKISPVLYRKTKLNLKFLLKLKQINIFFFGPNMPCRFTIAQN